MGSGVYEQLQGRDGLTVARILYRHPLSGAAEEMRTEDFGEILADPEIEAVVEVLGGVEPARSFVKAALRAGKHVITANKLMLSSDLPGILAAAREGGAQLRCSASVGGGIPFLPNLLRARRADRLIEVGGIVNGTTNLILDVMQREGAEFDKVLAQAQRAGFAEADPSADVDGVDAQCKLSIAASVAFDAFVAPEAVAVAGIRNIRGADAANFLRLKRVCRLLTRAVRTEKGVCAYVEPTLVPESAPEAAVLLNDNRVCLRGERVGAQAFSGQGAGKAPTAYAVVNDLLDLISGAPAAKYVSTSASLPADSATEAHCYYVRTRAPMALPGERIGEGLYLTRPVPVSEMHYAMAEAAKADPETFFAGIRD